MMQIALGIIGYAYGCCILYFFLMWDFEENKFGTDDPGFKRATKQIAILSWVGIATVIIGVSIVWIVATIKSIIKTIKNEKIIQNPRADTDKDRWIYPLVSRR